MIVKVDRDFFLLNFFHHVCWSLNTKDLENSFKNDLTEEKRLLCSAPGRKIRETAWSYDKVFRFGARYISTPGEENSVEQSLDLRLWTSRFRVLVF